MVDRKSLKRPTTLKKIQNYKKLLSVKFREGTNHVTVKGSKVKPKAVSAGIDPCESEDDELMQAFNENDVLRLMGLTDANSEELPKFLSAEQIAHLHNLGIKELRAADI